MSGQVWNVDERGGYMYSDELSDYLRLAMKPLTRFQNFCDAKDASKKGLHKGEEFKWNIFSKIQTAGSTLTEGVPMPETNFTIKRGSLTVSQYGKSFAALFSNLCDNLCSVIVRFNMAVMA